MSLDDSALRHLIGLLDDDDPRSLGLVRARILEQGERLLAGLLQQQKRLAAQNVESWGGDAWHRYDSLQRAGEELAKRYEALSAEGGYKFPDHQTPWQEIQRGMVDQLADGMVLKPAVKYQRVAQKFGVARDNH